MSQKGAQVFFPRTYTSDAAITRYRAVKRGTDAGHVAQGTLNAQCLGVSMDGADAADRDIPVADRPGEKPIVEASGAIALDTAVKSDANGRLVAAAAGEKVLGWTREVSTALGDLVQIELAPYGTLA